MGKTVSKADLSEIVGRDERTLTRWQNDGMPVTEFGLGRGNENQYDTEAVIQWLMHQAALNGKKNLPAIASTGSALIVKNSRWPKILARWSSLLI
ncbi:terminase small subunit [Pseudomonas sp. B24_DOA]|nr:terminase small subunit [Pseudomonas sp. B24_DOA]WKV88236.1 terminase small subunit [Pseudomonas sp. B21_DOA]